MMKNLLIKQRAYVITEAIKGNISFKKALSYAQFGELARSAKLILTVKGHMTDMNYGSNDELRARLNALYHAMFWVTSDAHIERNNETYKRMTELQSGVGSLRDNIDRADTFTEKRKEIMQNAMCDAMTFLEHAYTAYKSK